MPSLERAQRSNHRFEAFATWVSKWTGRSSAFLAALVLIVVWAVSGPVFGFSDTWQLVINTGTTIITFLMVFVIHNAANRDASAVHLKLDELIRVTAEARDALIGAEVLDQEALDHLTSDEVARSAGDGERTSEGSTTLDPAGR